MSVLSSMSRCLPLLCLLFSPISALFPSIGKLQSVAVEGKLLCNDKPYEHAHLKLYDVDFGLPDDLMGEGRSKVDGTFRVEGSETEWTKIDPKVNIYHNCNDENKECWRKIEIRIPDDFIAEGNKAEKTFSVGTLNLGGTLPGESRDCFN